MLRLLGEKKSTHSIQTQDIIPLNSFDLQVVESSNVELGIMEQPLQPLLLGTRD